MSNIIRRTTELALHLVQPYAKPGMTVVDATCGNGHDTLALARMAADGMDRNGMKQTGPDSVGMGSVGMGPAKLYAFDIQPAAVEATRQLLAEHGFESIQCEFICDNHANMARYVQVADIIVFNLGYLPGGDKDITTCVESTIAAVKSALGILREDGIICITMYSGHEAGAKEKAALLEFAGALDSRVYHAAYVNLCNQPNNPPEILLITRKDGKVGMSDCRNIWE